MAKSENVYVLDDTRQQSSIAATSRELDSPLTRFMERRGRKIVEGCGSLWHSSDGGMLISYPYHQQLAMSKEEMAGFLSSNGITGARFPSRVWAGKASGAYLLRNKQYGLQSVHTSFRQKIRKSTPLLEIREVDPDELFEQGRQLNLDTMQRQGRFDPEFAETAKWKRLVNAAADTPGIRTFGAFHGKELEAYIIASVEDRVMQLLHQMSRASSLSLFPNHALTFEVSRSAMADPDIDAVCYGLESLVQTSGLHRYKLDFGYDFVEHNSVIALHPYLSFLKSGPVRSMIRFARQKRPGDQRLERIDTVLKTASLSSLPLSA